MVGVDLGLAAKTTFAISYGDSVCLYFSDGRVLGLEAPFATGTAADTFDMADADEGGRFFSLSSMSPSARS
jgi:hypothetical protein